eukprot:Platyproteum_vivax@DN5817_c0_g1_i1.p1
MSLNDEGLSHGQQNISCTTPTSKVFPLSGVPTIQVVTKADSGRRRYTCVEKGPLGGLPVLRMDKVQKNTLEIDKDLLKKSPRNLITPKQKGRRYSDMGSSNQDMTKIAKILQVNQSSHTSLILTPKEMKSLNHFIRHNTPDDIDDPCLRQNSPRWANRRPSEMTVSNVTPRPRASSKNVQTDQRSLTPAAQEHDSRHSEMATRVTRMMHLCLDMKNKIKDLENAYAQSQSDLVAEHMARLDAEHLLAVLGRIPRNGLSAKVDRKWRVECVLMELHNAYLRIQHLETQMSRVEDELISSKNDVAEAKNRAELEQDQKPITDENQYKLLLDQERENHSKELRALVSRHRAAQDELFRAEGVLRKKYKYKEKVNRLQRELHVMKLRLRTARGEDLNSLHMKHSIRTPRKDRWTMTKAFKSRDSSLDLVLPKEGMNKSKSERNVRDANLVSEVKKTSSVGAEKYGLLVKAMDENENKDMNSDSNGLEDLDDEDDVQDTLPIPTAHGNSPENSMSSSPREERMEAMKKKLNPLARIIRHKSLLNDLSENPE